MFPGTNILDPLFWIVFGALQVLIVTGAYGWLKHYNRKVSWWQMVLMYAGFLSICATIAGGFTLMGEYESTAGWYFIGTLVLPQLIVLAILIRLFVFKKRAAVA